MFPRDLFIPVCRGNLRRHGNLQRCDPVVFALATPSNSHHDYTARDAASLKSVRFLFERLQKATSNGVIEWRNDVFILQVFLFTNNYQLYMFLTGGLSQQMTSNMQDCQEDNSMDVWVLLLRFYKNFMNLWKCQIISKLFVFNYSTTIYLKTKIKTKILTEKH